jgi:hypothetical protein
MQPGARSLRSCKIGEIVAFPQLAPPSKNDIDKLTDVGWRVNALRIAISRETCSMQELAGVSGTMKSDIAALDLTTGSPIFGEPVLRQNHLLTALPLVVGASPEVPRRRRKSAPDRGRALLAINALWPNGVPDKIILHTSNSAKKSARGSRKGACRTLRTTRF